MIKRRRDWLLGRWTAKHLVRQFLEAKTGQRQPLAAIVIQADPDGAPYASLASTAEPTRLPISISISHSDHCGFCALWPGADAQVGADIELIEQRDWPLVETFFTTAEQEQVRTADPTTRDALITAIWSGKEAMLKATRSGLRADTRQVECRFPANLTRSERWQAFQAGWDPAILPAAQSHHMFCTAWRLTDNHVLTLALLGDAETAARQAHILIAD